MIALITVWLTTGGNFIAFKFALEEFPPVLMMALRLLLAGIALTAAALLVRAPAPSRAQAARGVVACTLLLVLGQGGIVWGVQDLPAGRTAVFASSAPVFIAAFQALRGKPLSWRSSVGIGLGILGLALLALSSEGHGEIDLFPIACVLGGSAIWAVGSIYTAESELPQHPLVSGAVQTLVAAVMLIPVAWLAGDFARIDPEKLGTESLLALAYLAIFGLAIGYSIFAWIDRSSGPVLANTFHYVSPVIALVIAAVLLGESLTTAEIAAAAAALSGVALMLTGKSREGRSARPERRQKSRSLDSDRRSNAS